MLGINVLKWSSVPSFNVAVRVPFVASVPALPTRSELKDLAQRGWEEAQRRGREARPVLQSAAGKLAGQAFKAGQQFSALLRSRLAGTSRGVPAIAGSVGLPAALSLPAQKFNGRAAGKLTLAKLLFSLLLASVTREAPSAAASGAAKAKTRWLISRNDDLLYMLGSSAVSYFFMALLFIFKVNPAIIYWLWVVVFDAPHVAGTFTRTYADTQEWRSRRRLLLGSLLFFLPGPLAARLGQAQLFDTVATTWAYYHLIKQHYGFSVLYKKKNNDLAKIDNYLDKAMIMTGFWLPFIQFIFRPNFPSNYTRLDTILPKWLPKVAAAVFYTTLGAYVTRQVYKLATRQPVDLPKHLLLASSIGMHMVAFRLPYTSLKGGPYAFACLRATLTVYHNVQYNRLIWFHNRNKYLKAAQEGESHGLATRLSKNAPSFALYVFLLGLAYRIPFDLLSQGRLGVNKELARYIGGFSWGFAFVHYYLDSKIWHVRRDARLSKALSY
ncbi:MAG TPA: hypothetical protein VH186_01300 [Chloroflexia bacterium]|nr:hypothetical protein [Chloroflexia bacterium]